MAEERIVMKPKIVLTIEGGVLQGVRADTEMDILVIDYDVIKDGGDPYEMFVSTESKQELDFEKEKTDAKDS